MEHLQQSKIERWQTDPPFCNKYTQSVLYHLPMSLLFFLMQNVATIYAPPAVGVLRFYV